MVDQRPDQDHDAVCTSSARHLVVVAPPGTGKTYLSVRLAGERAFRLAPPSRVLLLTFSNQARAQLEREARRQLEPAIRARIAITNYHRFFWAIVRAHRRALGLPMDLELVSRAQRFAALASADQALVKRLRKQEGLLESIAEHEIPAFQDERTPLLGELDGLMKVVHAEHAAGRLVFDDLGALFWQLLETYPVLEAAYRRRYPVVIADEHQDASALQDAVVRRFGKIGLMIFADPMQLIHGFRGADPSRLAQHLDGCDETRNLTTPHRWHGDAGVSRWLMALREQLEGRKAEAQRPPGFVIETVPARYGLGAIKSRVKLSALAAFKDGCHSVAVLANTNADARKLQNYLCAQNMYPRRISSAHFDENRQDIEQLPLLKDPQSVSLHVLARVEELVPTLPTSVLNQIRQRLGSTSINAKRAGATARSILSELDAVYRRGATGYLDAITGIIKICTKEGHHLPYSDAVRPLQQASRKASQSGDLAEALSIYASCIAEASHHFSPVSTGLYIMTTHQAKGREFDAVIVASAAERFYPDTADGRRLFYVALTRATRRWTIVEPDQGASSLLRYC